MMYIAYNAGERPDVRPCSLLSVRSRIIYDNGIKVEEVYNAEFISNAGGNQIGVIWHPKRD